MHGYCILSLLFYSKFEPFLAIEEFVQTLTKTLSPNGHKFMFCEEGTEGYYQKRPHSDAHQAQHQAIVHTRAIGVLLSFDG